MKTYDNEAFQIEYMKNVSSSRIMICGNFFKCKRILYKIKKQNNWINSSGKKDPPPDFYSDKYKLMMDAMAINDVEYIKNGKIVNDQKKRQHQLLQKYLGKDYRKVRDDLRVFYNYDQSLDEHNYDKYKASFKRVTDKHNDSVDDYNKNHPGYKSIFYIFDESLEYIDYVNDVVHLCFNDNFFIDIIKQLRVDYVVWLTSQKYIFNKNGKEIKIPKVAIYEVKNINKYNYIDYSKYNLQPIK